ncbi:Kelch repeat-containing protein [Parafilimonas sp.]|uniref:Kelch repeat-containing protein n=1 Tax=Parafilimonas sp. TaxID=1969739 RepID=UPI0039E70EB3
MLNLKQAKILNRNAWMLVALLSSALYSCDKSSDDDDYEGNWARSSDFEGVVRTEAVTFTIGDYAYVGTGYKGSDTRLKDFWQFDASTGTWKQMADLPGIERNSAVAFTISGEGYVGTGYDGTNKLNDFYQYDPDTNTWTQKADFGGSARYDAIGFSVNSMGYIATGFDDNYLKDNWKYNPSTDTWTQVASLGGYKRMGATVFVIDDLAYVCTGDNNGDKVNDFWYYDGSADTWTELRKISDANSDKSYDDDYTIVRDDAVAFVMNGKGYITCGENSGIIATTWEYTPSTDLWVERYDFEGTPRIGAVAFTLNDVGYVVTGNNSSSQFDDCWSFDPTEDQTDDDN